MRWLNGAAAVMMLLTASGCPRGNSDAKLRIAVITNNAHDFWSMDESGSRAATAKLNADSKGTPIALEFRKPPNGSASEQQEMIENLLGTGIKGLAVSPNNAGNMVPFYRDKVVAKNVSLVMQDNDLPEADLALRQCYIGTHNYRAGLAAGKLITEACPAGGKLAIFVGKADAQNAIERRQGVLDYLADPNPKHLDTKELGPVTPWDATSMSFGKFVLVDTRIDETKAAKCQETAEDLLAKHPDLVCLVGLWEYNPPALLRAVKQAKSAKPPTVVGFDENFQTLDAIKTGACYATVVQNPYEFGYQSVQVLVALANGKQIDEILKGLKDSKSGAPLPADDKRRVFIPYRVITKDNVGPFYDEVKQLKGS